MALATQPVIVWADCACLDDVSPSRELAKAIEEEQAHFAELRKMTPEERAERMRSYDATMASLDDLCRMMLQRLLGVARRAGDREHADAYTAALDGHDIDIEPVTLRRVPMASDVAAGYFA